MAMNKSCSRKSMFRDLTRKKQKLSLEECKEILKQEVRGVLAVNGDDGYPYALPINFYFDERNNKIYFHSGKVGHKLDAIDSSDKVSFWSTPVLTAATVTVCVSGGRFTWRKPIRQRQNLSIPAKWWSFPGANRKMWKACWATFIAPRSMKKVHWSAMLYCSAKTWVKANPENFQLS